MCSHKYHEEAVRLGDFYGMPWSVSLGLCYFFKRLCAPTVSLPLLLHICYVGENKERRFISFYSFKLHFSVVCFWQLKLRHWCRHCRCSLKSVTFRKMVVNEYCLTLFFIDKFNTNLQESIFAQWTGLLMTLIFLITGSKRVHVLPSTGVLYTCK